MILSYHTFIGYIVRLYYHCLSLLSLYLLLLYCNAPIVALSVFSDYAVNAGRPFIVMKYLYWSVSLNQCHRYRAGSAHPAIAIVGSGHKPDR